MLIPRNKRQTYIVYSIGTHSDEVRAYYTPIGKAEQHADGRGFNFELSALPATGFQLVMRMPEPTKRKAKR